MNFYEYLGVSQTSSETEIKQAFRALAKKKHPDHNKKDTAFWEMVELNVIRDTLINPEKRKKYDRSLATGETYQEAPQTTQPAHPPRKRNTIYTSVKSLFTYHCRVCGLEMSSTWQGYCLLHFLEATGQIDNQDFVFEYAGQRYKWADPPNHLREQHFKNNLQTTAGIRIKPWQIIAYTTLIALLSLYIVFLASQYMH